MSAWGNTSNGNVSDEEVITFLDAAEAGNWNFVEAWLMFGADRRCWINYAPNGRRSALHHAAWWGSEGAARMLLGYGADPAMATSDGKTPANVALEVGDDSLANFLGTVITLAEVNSFIDAAKVGDWDAVESWLITKPERVSLVNDMPMGRWSALHHAACHGTEQSARMLLKYGADPTLRNRDGKTPADIARGGGACIRRPDGGASLGELIQNAALAHEQRKLLLKNLHVVFGNTAKLVKEGQSENWEWQVFLFTRPSSSVIERVVMGPENPVHLARGSDSSCFISGKITGWDTPSVELLLYFQGTEEPAIVAHNLDFDKRGASNAVVIDMDETYKKQTSSAEAAAIISRTETLSFRGEGEEATIDKEEENNGAFTLRVSDDEVNSFLDAAKAGNWDYIEAWLLFDADHRCRINHTPNNRWSALHHAARQGSEDAVRMLLKYGANRHLRNADDDAPADVARESGNVSLTAFLKTYKSQTDLPFFLDAAEAGRWDEVEVWLLADLERMMHLNDMPNGRWSALHQAARWKSRGAAQMLIKYGADPSLKSADGKTAIDVAIESGDKSLAAFLDAAPRKESVESFLFLAKAGQWDKVEHWLLESPNRVLHVNDRPNGRWSALHQAAWWKSDKAVRMLLKYGADPTCRDKEGRTPADIARRKGSESVGHLICHAAEERGGKISLSQPLSLRRLPKLDVVVGNTAVAVRQEHGKWEWQMFVFTRPSSYITVIRLIIIDLRLGSANANALEMVRNEDSGSFFSGKVTGRAAFEVQLHIYFHELREPFTLHHLLKFSEGGTSNTVGIDLDKIHMMITSSMDATEVTPDTIFQHQGKEDAKLPTATKDGLTVVTKPTIMEHGSEAAGSSATMLHTSNVAEGVAGIAAMKVELAKKDSQRKQMKYIAEAAAAVGAIKYTSTEEASPKLDLVVGNTATQVLTKLNTWEWRIFLRPLQSRPPMSVVITHVIMELDETFENRRQELKRVEYGQFISRRMMGWGTFDVILRVHIRGLSQPVTLRHFLCFDGGGSSAHITVVPKAAGEEQVRLIRNLDIFPSDDIAIDNSPPETQQGQAPADNVDAETLRFTTRASLEEAICRCQGDIHAAKEGKDINKKILEKADMAQKRLNQLLSLRKELPTVEDLKNQISEIESQREYTVGEGNFSLAIELQEEIESLKNRLHMEEEETATKKGRNIMQRIIDEDLDPEPIPYKYLEECTSHFSDQRRLGEGAFSEVFMAKDKLIRRKFAVKRLRVSVRAHADVKQARKMFEVEVMTLKHFRHPNIARLYAYYLSSDLAGTQCLVFELASKGSLDFLLKHKAEQERLHWTTRINIALDVSKALEYLHNGSSGQVCYHRDIKSANICIRRDNRALIIDCGVSKMIPEHETNMTMTVMDTTGAALRGTRGYICPHFARSMRGYSSASDVFSLGIVFAEIFTGALQNSCVNGEDVDLFDWFSRDGMLQRKLQDYEDESADMWPVNIRCIFTDLATEMIQMRPGDRPKIDDIVRRVGVLASKARRWSPGERNQIKVLSSAPLVWADSAGEVHPITSSPDFRLERDVLSRCIDESKRDIKLSFDVATDDRLLAAATNRCGCLHFSGHGAPEFLVLEDGTGGAHFLGSRDLHDCVHKEPFRFAFVSACYSALMGQAFVEAGVPHVVCCNHDEELLDAAALKFAHSFYFAAAQGFTVQAAFDKGKQAVAKRFGRSEESKFMLLPKTGDHDEPLFDAEVLEWEDDENHENFIPPLPPHFVGRETDMYMLLQALLSRRLVTLVGVEGVGCSSLASAVSHYIKDRKTTIPSIQEIYFVRADIKEEKTSLERFVNPLQQLLVSEGKMSDPGDKVFTLEHSCKNVCKSLEGTKALVIFDEADTNDGSLADVVTFIIRNTTSVKMLLTGHTSICSSFHDVNEHVINVNSLDIKSTAVLFGKLCPWADTIQKRRALQANLIERSGGSSLQKKAFFGKFGGGLPSDIINSAKKMTRSEYEMLHCKEH